MMNLNACSAYKNLTWIADEFEQYRWTESKSDGVIKEVPYKVNDDAMDMIRYFAISFKKEVESGTLPDDTEMFKDGGFY